MSTPFVHISRTILLTQKQSFKHWPPESQFLLSQACQTYLYSEYLCTRVNMATAQMMRQAPTQQVTETEIKYVWCVYLKVASFSLHSRLPLFFQRVIIFSIMTNWAHVTCYSDAILSREKIELFPKLKKGILTVKQSKQFMKRMTAIAISSITYLRGMFPEDCFGDRALEGLK